MVGEQFPVVHNSPLPGWAGTKSLALEFPVHLLQLDSLPDQSLCSHIFHRSLMPSLSLSCSPSVTTHLHLPLPSPHLQSWQQLLFSHQVFFLHVWSQSFRLQGAGTQQFQASKTEIPTLLLRTAVDRGCTKNPREPGKRERGRG